ncbi:MAG: transposase [Gammaproteobacteria bacterium]|nr:transposase [Gammaproteobacteria bacterium]
MTKVAKAIKRHWDGVFNWFDRHLTNARLRVNRLIQAAKSRAGDYRSNGLPDRGKWEFDLPLETARS